MNLVNPTGVRQPVMADVAKQAGVSHQTVSRVLNNHPNVSASARERVEAAISALGYRRNLAARSLATRTSTTLGVLVSELSLFGPGHIVAGIESTCQQVGLTVSIGALSEMTADAVGAALARFAEHGVVGVVCIVPHPRVLRALNDSEWNFPIAVTGAVASDSYGTVTVSHREGARLAVRHLRSLGHTRIGHLSGPEGWHDAAERKRGWREELAAHDLVPGLLIEGDWSARSGYEAALQVANMGGVSAMFVANDQMALGFLRGVHEMGLRVPEDISVVGYDDQPEAGYFYPPLTTVRPDFEGLGAAAVNVVVAAAGQDVAGVALQRVPVLVVRQSTGVARAGL